LLIASGSSGEATRLTLTHKGVCEVGRARSRSALPTEHFPPLDEIQATLADDLPSDQNSTAKVAELTALAESDRLEVLRMARSLQEWADRLALGEEQRAEYEADIRTIEAQLDSPRRKTELIKVALESIKSVAKHASNSPGFVGNIVSVGIASTIEEFVARF
jgi:chromosome segregation ATPase